MKPITTEAERAAIEAVKAAIKALPRGITVEIDSWDGLMSFWKRSRNEFGPGIKTAEEAASPLKCARAFRL